MNDLDLILLAENDGKISYLGRAKTMREIINIKNLWKNDNKNISFIITTSNDNRQIDKFFTV